MESLDLSKNNLSGDIPTSLMRLSKMTKLYLWVNQLSGKIPHNIDEPRSICFLDFSNNWPNGMIPQTIMIMTHSVSLCMSRLIGFIPTKLGMLVHLIRLDLSSNSHIGWLPQNLGTHSDLWLVNVVDKYFEGPFPRNLCKQGNIHAFLIFSNNFNGSLQYLDSCSSPQYAHLFQNQLSGEVLGFIEISNSCCTESRRHFIV